VARKQQKAAPRSGFFIPSGLSLLLFISFILSIFYNYKVENNKKWVWLLAGFDISCS
jgi:hypothetical protein